MKRILSFAIISMMLVMNANAQIRLGVTAGVNSANWQGDAVESMNNIVNYTNGYITTKSRTGFHIGVNADIPLSEKMSFQPGLQYSQKGFRMVGDLDIPALKFLGANASANVQADYIDIPIVLKAEVAKGLSIFAGPQISYLVKNNLKLKAGILGFNLLNSDLDITDNFNRMDFGVTGGLGYQFDNGFNIKAGYDYGLSKLDKNSNFNAYNRVVKVSLGINF